MQSSIVRFRCCWLPHAAARYRESQKKARMSLKSTAGPHACNSLIAAEDARMVEELIGRMDRWLAANRPDYYALLQPGATDAELDVFEARFSLKLPAAFRELYRWRSGQDPMSSAPLQGNRSFCTLEEVASTKDMLDGMIGYDFD